MYLIVQRILHISSKLYNAALYYMYLFVFMCFAVCIAIIFIMYAIPPAWAHVGPAVYVNKINKQSERRSLAGVPPCFSAVTILCCSCDLKKSPSSRNAVNFLPRLKLTSFEQTGPGE
uniref:Uncharacterized protein n=1 Tax=Ixodes ricinus TaxID=34613 RepID=A0A6B0ULI8_IXORI